MCLQLLLLNLSTSSKSPMHAAVFYTVMVLETNNCVYWFVLNISLFWSLLTVTTALPAVSLVSALPSPQVNAFSFLFLHFLITTFKSTNDDDRQILSWFQLHHSWVFFSVFFRRRELMQPCFSSLQTQKTGYASPSVQLTSWSSPLHYSGQKRFFFSFLYAF